MEHFVSQIKITNVRHLSNINIELNRNSRQHLLLTGKNGSGKTSVLLAMRKYLQAINEGKLNVLRTDYRRWLNEAEKDLARENNGAEQFKAEERYDSTLSIVQRYVDGVEIDFTGVEELDSLYKKGQFITAFFPADRKTVISRYDGVQKVTLKENYDINSDPAKILQKYMVHLKTQQSYATNEKDYDMADKIEGWFRRFEKALRILFDDDSLVLEYDYKNYDFKIIEAGRKPFNFEQLSAGYSSVIHIISDLMIRMDQNWIMKNKLSDYNIEGIVLIDELETHLHIELQRKILPFLTEFFPKIQFIVTTHSPYILNSISNAIIYDLEKQMEVEDMSGYSTEGIVEGYFEADEYSDKLRTKLERYVKLVEQEMLTEEERAERATLRHELQHIPPELSNEVRAAFEEIEERRKVNGKI